MTAIAPIGDASPADEPLGSRRTDRSTPPHSDTSDGSIITPERQGVAPSNGSPTDAPPVSFTATSDAELLAMAVQRALRRSPVRRLSAAMGVTANHLADVCDRRAVLSAAGEGALLALLRSDASAAPILAEITKRRTRQPGARHVCARS